MPVFRLNDKPLFPPVELSSPEGIIAAGGDLSSERLLAAYSSGIFPWYSDDQPILWWSPDPRFVLFPGQLHVSRSLRRAMNKQPFTITYDTSFEGVIKGCSLPRRDGFGTWITHEMREAYLRLHRLGYAHSVEAWEGEKLAGGMYGVSLGSCFFGESMFTRVSNASKTALVTLVEALMEKNFTILDCQVYTENLDRFGAVHIPRVDFLDILAKGMEAPTLRGNWGELLTR